MTAGREGEIALKKNDKIDRTGPTPDLENINTKNENAIKNDDENKYLMKINTAEPPRYNYMSALKQYGDRRTNSNL